jgi:hypothetical protein
MRSAAARRLEGIVIFMPRSQPPAGGRRGCGRAERSASAAERSRRRRERLREFDGPGADRYEIVMASEAAPQGRSIVATTLRALVAPRRALPILLVCAPIILLQWRLSDDPRAAPLGVALCASFVLFAPLAWRALVREGLPRVHVVARVMLYGACGAAWVVFAGKLVPAGLGMPPTLLSLDSSVVVCCALFLVGGWGLARDIDSEARLQREQRRAALLEREGKHAQILALQAHLDPHFLFNTLNAIAEWCREDGEVAERAVLQLSNILRTMLTAVKSPRWHLRTELDLVRAVFDLHRIRDPDRFALEWSVPSPLPDVSLPPMLLLPVAENAIKHGPAAGHPGVVRLAVALDGDALRVTVENEGRYAGPRAGSDGLPFVQRRLDVSYEGSATMRIVGDGDRTRVELGLPRAGPRDGIVA